MEKVLIIEDDPAILLALKDELSEKYQVLTADKAEEGMCIAEREEPEIILLDILLPDLNGIEACRKMREKGIDSVIIMLTALGQISDKVKGLDAGADDYITKPFSFSELYARMKAVLRRRESLRKVDKYKDGVLDIDFKAFRVLRGKRRLNLSFLELNLIRFLISKRRDPVSRSELLSNVWGHNMNIDTRTVDVCIASLRKKIGKGYIRTVYGKGYVFKEDS